MICTGNNEPCEWRVPADGLANAVTGRFCLPFTTHLTSSRDCKTSPYKLCTGLSVNLYPWAIGNTNPVRETRPWYDLIGHAVQSLYGLLLSNRALRFLSQSTFYFQYKSFTRPTYIVLPHNNTRRTKFVRAIEPYRIQRATKNVPVTASNPFLVRRWLHWSSGFAATLTLGDSRLVSLWGSPSSPSSGIRGDDARRGITVS